MKKPTPATETLTITVNSSRIADILADLDNNVNGCCRSSGVRIGTFGKNAVVLTIQRDDDEAPPKSRKYTSVTKKLTSKRKED